MGNDAMDHLVYKKPGKPRTKEDREKIADWHLAQAIGKHNRNIKNASTAFQEKIRQDRKRLGLD